MIQNIRYIVVHSTQTLPGELYSSVSYHFVIHRNGNIEKGKRISPVDGCIQVAYVGGIDRERKPSDTKTEAQSEALFDTILELSEKHPDARLVSADFVFGNHNFPGFDVCEWMNQFTPSLLNKPAA